MSLISVSFDVLVFETIILFPDEKPKQIACFVN